MKRELKQNRYKRPAPCSFRFSETTVTRIKVLAAYHRCSQAQLLTNLVDSAYEEIQSKDGHDLITLEAKVKALVQTQGK